jgi:hypothetical protein
MGTLDVGRLRILTGAHGKDGRCRHRRGERSIAEPCHLGTGGSTRHPCGAGISPRDEQVELPELFPGVHLRYELRRGVLLRGSYSTSMARPNFGDIMPDTTIDDPNLNLAEYTGLRRESDNFMSAWSTTSSRGAISSAL